MKCSSLRNLDFLIIEDLVYSCIVHNILHNVLVAFDQAQLCIINSIFKHIIIY